LLNKLSIYTIVDDLLKKVNEVGILEKGENNTVEYNEAQRLLWNYYLVNYVKYSSNKKHLQLTKIGAEVLHNGGFANNLNYLKNQKELNEKIRFEKAKSEIGNHIQSRRYTKTIFIFFAIILFSLLIKLIFF
jgi:hypothetical protein